VSWALDRTRDLIVLDLLIGVAFGAAVAWTTYAGIYDQLTWTRGQRFRSLPASFWYRSLTCAAARAVIGGILMWRVQHGI
jgi:hypothetical protein